MNKLHFAGPIILAVLDGVGIAPDSPGNAVTKARMPFLNKVFSKYLYTTLDASGEAVGLLPDTMGNSEVGHNTMGCGQIIKHGIAHIEEAFENGSIWQSKVWQTAIKKAQNATLHFAGIFSDGGVHSHISELERMIEKSYHSGVKVIRLHAIFDGRDVPPQSEPQYIKRIEKFVKQFPDLDFKIASGGGRMTTTADRYGNDWEMVRRGFYAMVHGSSKHHFSSALEAITTFRQQQPDIQDQNLPDFVIVDKQDNPVGKIQKNDVVVYIDFRADRAIEISTALTAERFTHFGRSNFNPNDIYFVGLTEYNSDKHIPQNILIPPVTINHTLHEFLGACSIKTLAISETAKFGHITYYFDGDSYDKAKNEDFIEVPSYIEPFDTRPWMKAAEITDTVLKNANRYQFIRINFPNGDMVGHFADIDSTIIAMEAIDLSLKRLAEKVDELGGCLIITADHGNAEELLDENGEKKTAHSMNRVPFAIYDNTDNCKKYRLRSLDNPGLANIAATIAMLLGETPDKDTWQKPLIMLK